MFAGILKWFRNWFRRGSRRTHEAADNVYAGSASGIADAFDDHRDELVGQYTVLRDAISEIEMVLEEQRQALDAANERERDKIELRDGALAKFEEAEASGNEDEIAKWEEHYVRLSGEIEEIEREQETIDAIIKQQESAMKTHLGNLTDLQREIEALPAEKAREIATHVSSSKLIELSDRLNGLQSSVDRGPIDAVRAANRKLSAKARVVQKLDGTDSKRQDDELRQAGRKLAGREQMRATLAARKAEKAAATGGEAPETAAAETEGRPKI